MQDSIDRLRKGATVTGRATPGQGRGTQSAANAKGILRKSATDESDHHIMMGESIAQSEQEEPCDNCFCKNILVIRIV